MENLEFYNKYKQVPKNAMKPFDNGKFSGTDINSMWRIKCLTESFGMVGFGWYYTIDKTWIEQTIDGQQLAFAKITLYVKVEGEWSKGIEATGGNKMFVKTKSGTSLSDECYKMAITDAFGVACKKLGIGADVYWENDRSKYTENYTQEVSKTKPSENITHNRFPLNEMELGAVKKKANAQECDEISPNLLIELNEFTQDLNVVRNYYKVSYLNDDLVQDILARRKNKGNK